MYKTPTTRVHCIIGSVTLLLAASTKRPLNQVANKCLQWYIQELQHMPIGKIPGRLLARTEREGNLYQGGQNKQLRIQQNLVNYVKLNGLNMSACIEEAIMRHYMKLQPTNRRTNSQQRP